MPAIEKYCYSITSPGRGDKSFYELLAPERHEYSGRVLYFHNQKGS